MLPEPIRWSHATGKRVVPSPWQMTEPCSETLSTAKLGTLLCRASPVFAGEPRSGRLA